MKKLTYIEMFIRKISHMLKKTNRITFLKIIPLKFLLVESIIEYIAYIRWGYDTYLINAL